MDVDWQADLDRWLAPFVAALRHKTRAQMCPFYVAGLIGPGDRKSVQPMAARAGKVGYDQLHHFVAAGVWNRAPRKAALLKEADDLVGDEAGFLVIDDTALPKKGHIPVDAHIYALRNRIERCFNKLKNSRGLATRYDKTVASYLGFVHIAAIRIWMRAFVNKT